MATATEVREMLEVLDSEEVNLETADTKATALHIAARCLGTEKLKVARLQSELCTNDTPTSEATKPPFLTTKCS